jgi:hypothetical protein
VSGKVTGVDVTEGTVNGTDGSTRHRNDEIPLTVLGGGKRRSGLDSSDNSAYAHRIAHPPPLLVEQARTRINIIRSERHYLFLLLSVLLSYFLKLQNA